ncbi:MerR family transcriptional regulator [Rhodococcus rhodnii]|uniref:HTH merR-type domain-containing protein n=2 Tax=Rhodococcus rhodnii TaxID=38312 RepID=R7WMU5_9NOCA|nr:MerR family transcriptional regulator [Rhodococcus rhodnii]EOM76646.1 hypothetical protein Rrhod_2043 [Rhodococcus rhodnii LMG 5362]TXG89514.1 MerR family transcriptional regulator [Rhodococcus rhodnii]
MSGREWSISELAAAAGTTSRALRHYGDVGILRPSRIGANGYRWYDDAGVVRLQRILLLRDLGLGLREIETVLHGESDTVSALTTHLELLEREQRRLTRQIESVRSTIRRTKAGEPLVMNETFDGFDHTRHKSEVIERWGEDAYREADEGWRGMSGDERRDLAREASALASEWQDAASAGEAPDGERAQALARRHLAWLNAAPGVPRTDSGELRGEYVRGLVQMYVDDERFAANYGGVGGARLVRDAVLAHLDRR